MMREEKIMLVSGSMTMLSFDKITVLVIKPIHLETAEERMVEYMQKNPMPKDKEYSDEDFINDITKSSGFYSLPDGIKEETIEYITDALNYFV